MGPSQWDCPWEETFYIPVVLLLTVTLKYFRGTALWSEIDEYQSDKLYDKKYSKLFWHSCLMKVNSIIKMELAINAWGRSYVVVPALFIEVFGVIYRHLFNMTGKESVHMVV